MADVLEGLILMGNMGNFRFEFSLKDSHEKLKLFWRCLDVIYVNRLHILDIVI